MLETYTLKQHLETVRQELAHALYQHDAACRVIARLIKERDSAKNALANLHGQAPSHSGAEQASAMEVDTNTLPESIKEKLTQKSQILSKDRKKRAVSAALATEQNIQSFSVQSSDTGIHKSSPAGITSLAIHPSEDLIVTGGMDGEIGVFNTQSRKLVTKLSGHSKRVNEVVVHPSQPLLFSASQDKTVRVWGGAGEEPYAASHIIRSHTDDVVGISLHATGDYLASASNDKSWAFHDIHTGATLTKTEDPTVKAGFSSISFHPDGLILGTGTKDHVVRIWDIKAQANVATFEGHTASVEDLSFSENGYHLATAGGDSVKLWDLRKLTNFHTIPLSGDVNSVSFDVSGQYLIVSHGDSVSIFGGKNYVPIKTFTDSTAKVTDAKFGKDALLFATTSLDRSLKLYSQ